MKKIFAFVTALWMGLLFCVHSASAETVKPTALAAAQLSASSAILINAENGDTYFEKNADRQMAPASTTKLMTALVALELCEPERMLTVPREAVGTEGSSVYLTEGEVLSLRELLYALLLSSANDAAVAIAVCLCGSVESFADKMNDRAAEMGLKDTHFVNPHGLYDESHYTTARELAKIGKEALSCPPIAEIVAKRKATISHSGEKDKRLLVNHNRLLSTYEGAVGMKTGFTKKAGRTLVSAATRNGLTLIAVTLDAPSDWQDHKILLDYGFENYEHRILYRAGEFTYSLPLCGGKDTAVTLTNKEPLSVTVRKGTGKFTPKIEASGHFAIAPVNKDECIGKLTLCCNEYEASSPLIVKNTVGATTKAKITPWERLISFFTVN